MGLAMQAPDCRWIAPFSARIKTVRRAEEPGALRALGNSHMRPPSQRASCQLPAGALPPATCGVWAGLSTKCTYHASMHLASANLASTRIKHNIQLHSSELEC